MNVKQFEIFFKDLYFFHEVTQPGERWAHTLYFKKNCTSYLKWKQETKKYNGNITGSECGKWRYSKDTKNHSHEEVDTLIILHGKL